MAPIRVFIAGITGYIGSATLDHLFKQDLSARTRYTFRALVRSPEKAERDVRPFGVEPVIGSLDDLDLLTEEASQADVVLNFADSDHIQSTKAILKGLQHRPRRQDAARKRPILIHTSGTGVLLDRTHGNVSGTVVYFDNDVAQLHSLPDTQAHRYVDLEIVDPSLVNKVDTYLIAPPTVWGRGTGLGNLNSVQIPYKVRYSIQHKQALQVGKGLNIWSRVHILDLARFNITLFERALQEPDEGEQPPSSKDWKPLPKNVDEYYFVEDGEFTYGEVAQEIAKALKAHGINDSGEVTSVDTVNDLKYFDEVADLIFGGNSRSRALRARQILGWKPEHTDFKGYIADEVKRQLQNQK